MVCHRVYGILSSRIILKNVDAIHHKIGLVSHWANVNHNFFGFRARRFFAREWICALSSNRRHIKLNLTREVLRWIHFDLINSARIY